jgi:hypothetical protein
MFEKSSAGNRPSSRDVRAARKQILFGTLRSQNEETPAEDPPWPHTRRSFGLIWRRLERFAADERHGERSRSTWKTLVELG